MKIHGPNATLMERIDWCEGLATLRILPDGWSFPDFVPGQFTNLALPEGSGWDEETGIATRRAYSIASRPGEPHVDFYIRLVKDGALTPPLFDLAAGDRLHMDDRAAGKFTLARVPDAEVLILVATGTGFGPFRPMLLDPGTHARFGSVVLIYSTRTPAELGYQEELAELASQNSAFHYLPTITRAPDEVWDGLRGRVTEHLTPEGFRSGTGMELSPETCQVLLCGNPAMVTDAQEALGLAGLKRHRRADPGQIHIEKYW